MNDIDSLARLIITSSLIHMLLLFINYCFTNNINSLALFHERFSTLKWKTSLWVTGLLLLGEQGLAQTEFHSSWLHTIQDCDYEQLYYGSCDESRVLELPLAPDGDYDFETIERNFDKNTYPFKEKLIKIKNFSDDYFQNKTYIKSIYDIIHIDGFHHFEQVYKDLNNCINLLNKNGILIIDDFLLYNYFKDNYNENPFGAAIVFLNKYKKKFKIIKITNQLILKKYN